MPKLTSPKNAFNKKIHNNQDIELYQLEHDLRAIFQRVPPAPDEKRQICSWILLD